MSIQLPQTAARPAGDEPRRQTLEPLDHAGELVNRLTDRGLRASAAPLGSPEGAPAVTAQRTDVHPYVGRLVALLPCPGSGELYWHWQRPFRGSRWIGARWFQPFSPAYAYDDTADAIAAVIADELRASARLRYGSAARPDAVAEPDGEVLVYTGHRVHALVSRMLERLKALENDLEDPDLLADLYGIDHLATQLRRAAARSAVLGGRTARRASTPMPVSTVLRQAMAEVEAYQRVRLTLPDDDMEIPGYAGPDVIHILAELVENATRFFGGTVRMVTVQAPGGLGVEVRDEGKWALSAARLAELRRILEAPFQVSLREQVRQGQVGLLVAARLAVRHGIRIELRPQSPGMCALVVLPHALLASPPGTTALPQALLRRRTPAPISTPASPPPDPAPTSAAAQEPPAYEQPPPTAPTALPATHAGRPPLPRRRKTSPAADAVPHPSGEPAPESSPARPPSPELMARFATGLRRGQAEQRHEPASEPTDESMKRFR
ncbi:ATP-binding protein [Actinomadura chokoriensis]|uniref:ATP-binding protein n=1 Tax=Actinomadura chokoriensis TaxID=454156 RepID=UPI0031F839ED